MQDRFQCIKVNVPDNSFLPFFKFFRVYPKTLLVSELLKFALGPTGDLV